MVTIGNFGEYREYTVSSDKITLKVFELGATAHSLIFDGREMIISHKDVQDYKIGSGNISVIVGRYANRIGGAKFTLNGHEYKLTANERGNTLHGGDENTIWSRRVWKGEIVGENAVKFTLFSPDGDNGFPGNMLASVTYSVEDDRVKLLFEGESDADTVFAPTSNMYFNLDGRKNMLTAEICINSSRWLEVGDNLVPTGKLADADGEYDFRNGRVISRDFDNAFALDGEHACSLTCSDTQMDIYTDFPAIHMYCGGGLPADVGKNSGIALEPEFYPDSPNKPQFPSTVLKKGEKFCRYAMYIFSKK